MIGASPISTARSGVWTAASFAPVVETSGIASAIPVLNTARVTLRAPSMADVDAYCDVLMSDRAALMGGPFSREDAWTDFCAGTAGWVLRGFGMWSMEDRARGDFLGVIFLHHEYGDPERELGWVLTKTAEGHGLAQEAARAARDHAFDVLGWDTVVSYIDRANVRSIAVAQALGAQPDPDAPLPSDAGDCVVYRHTPGART